MIEMDDWIHMINADDHEMQVGSAERVLVDSGAAVFSMSSRPRARDPIANSSRNATLRQKMIEYEHGEGGLGECQLRGRRRDQADGGSRRAAKTLDDGGGWTQRSRGKACRRQPGAFSIRTALTEFG